MYGSQRPRETHFPRLMMVPIMCHRMAAVFLSTIPMIVLSGEMTAAARTWYVYEDGSGDAPTIQAAFDLSASGDNILVGPGTYREHNIICRVGVSVRSISGQAETLIDAAGGGDGFVGYDWDAPSSIEGFTIIDAIDGGIALRGGGYQSIRSCVMVGCGAGLYGRNYYGTAYGITSVGNVFTRPSGSGFSFSYSSPSLVNCISAFNGGYGVVVWTYDFPTLMCCCVFGNEHGNFSGMEDPTGTNGNISVDPIFCDFHGGDYHLGCDSPCADENNPHCGQIGACPVGCGPSPAVRTTWGTVKHLFADKD